MFSRAFKRTRSPRSGRRPRRRQTASANALVELSSEDDQRRAITTVAPTAFTTAQGINDVQRRFGGALLNDKSLRAVQRLALYKAPMEKFPLVRRASVCVCLFAGRLVLPTCEATLEMLLVGAHVDCLHAKLHPWTVPGGKMDEMDDSLLHCARREAYEEIGLPMESEAIQYLTSLPPYLSRVNNLIVTPIVFFISDPSIQPVLNSDEVDSLFSHPLEGFLMNTPVEPVLRVLPPEVQSGRRPYHVCYDLGLHTATVYRMHQFESKRMRLVRGFTADICMAVARLAYGREPEFARKAIDQKPRKFHIVTALREQSDFRDAARKLAASRRESKL